jgi:hypothetical protein
MKNNGPKVFSYLRFSDPRQASGSSADRQQRYAQNWANTKGLVMDESLSLRDEGLSAHTHGPTPVPSNAAAFTENEAQAIALLTKLKPITL